MEILDVIRLLLFALYAPICFVVYRRLYPRLSQMSKRLATAMLAAQVLIIALSTAFYDYSGFTFWLWDLDTEYNIPATLASAQLALAAAVALLTLWQAKSRPAWQRVYFVGIAILFFHFARDEFFQFRQSYWLTSYTQLGIAVALATACLHLRVKRQQRAWSLSILAGLAMGGFGAIYLESLRGAQSCVAIGFYDHECLIYFLEEALEFLGMWLVLVGLLGFFSDDAPKPGRRWRIVYWLPVFWMLIHHAPHIVTYIGLPYSPHLAALVRYESGVELRMSRLSHDESVLSAQLYATSPNWTTYMGLGYSIHLVDQVSGASAAGADAHASRSYPAPYPYSLFGFRGWQNTYMQQLNIDIPPTRNRALWVVLTTWREEGAAFPRQAIESSDYPLLGENQVILGELVLPQEAEPPSSNPIARYENGMILSSADFPASAQAGQHLPIRFHWRGERAIAEEYTQFLHYSREGSADWLVFDAPPLGARLPTRLWYSGLADSEIWRVPLPADMSPGQYKFFTGLYRSSDAKRLPASAADGRPFTDARIPLGSLTIGVSD